jgi:chaperonin cofactor prefoldin
MNLSKKLEMLMEQFSKFVNDKPNVEMKIEDNSDMLLSEGGAEDHMEMIEGRLHAVESKLGKVESKQKKITTLVNKLNKQVN